MTSRITGYGVGSAKIALAPVPTKFNGVPSGVTRYDFGQLVQNTASGNWYLYSGGGVYVPLFGGSGSITITGNSGGPQTASAFTIVGVGGTTFDFVGGQFQITAAGGSGTTTLTGNSGVATQSAGNINVLGGTGVSTSGSGATLTLNNTGVLSVAGNTGGALTGALSLVGSGAVSVAGSGSTLTISSSAVSSQTWNLVGGTTQAMVAGNGYISTNAALTTLTLPATAVPLVDIVKVVGYGTAGVVIAQQANTQIILFNGSSTVGVGGNIQSSAGQPSDISLICASNGGGTFLWVQFEASQGNFTVT